MTTIFASQHALQDVGKTVIQPRTRGRGTRSFEWLGIELIEPDAISVVESDEAAIPESNECPRAIKRDHG